ncbi:MAG TPA: NTP transferase domain-containing protein [candidate division Zixibacteria bacterium]|nr:NTP transferase domain-containing protein [candidate division Zixibacteria bacterium]
MPAKRAAIVLAAGKGKRMHSDLPKVLHPIHGRPMIRILLETLKTLDLDRIVVVIGFKGELVEQELKGEPVRIVWQHKQEGTGHAVRMAEKLMEDFDGTTLIALGDVPFLSAASIRNLMDRHESSGAAATCLSAFPKKPAGYGRIIRDGDSDLLKEIVEHKDATEEQLKIGEINSGTFCFDNRLMFKALARVGKDNAQKEYYLPDAVKILRAEGHCVAVVAADDADECLGVNSVEQLEELAAKFDI